MTALVHERRFRWRLIIIGLITMLAFGQIVQADSPIFVDANAIGENDGSSWEDAYTDIQSALAEAEADDEIWVAATIYKPGDLVTDTFQLQNGVALYGGFNGTEASLEERDWEANLTILSGDIDNNDVTGENGIVTGINDDIDELSDRIIGSNSYHVVTGSGTDSTAILDGFVITSGSANDAPDWEGGGIRNVNGSPTLSNLLISGNQAFDGGGIANLDGSNPLMDNVNFTANDASVGSGGGMANFNSSPTITNALFYKNRAMDVFGGGGLYNFESSLLIENSAFIENWSIGDGSGGGILNREQSSSVIVNTIFANNSVYGDADGGGLASIGGVNTTVINSLFYGNFAGENGGGVSINGSSVDLNNVTISGNYGSEGAGGLWVANTDVEADHEVNVENSIIWNNEDGDDLGTLSENIGIATGIDPIISHSLIQNSGGSDGWDDAAGIDGGGNIDSDPLFVDPVIPSSSGQSVEEGDLRLQDDSPALNVGNNDANDTAVDLDANGRIVNDIIDLGPYENQTIIDDDDDDDFDPQAALAQLLAEVETLVEEEELSASVARPLLWSLNTATDILEAGNSDRVVQLINYFVAKVERLERREILTDEIRHSLIDQAQEIIAALEK